MSVKQKENIYWLIFCNMASNNAISPLGGFSCKCFELYDAENEQLHEEECGEVKSCVESDSNDASDGDGAKNYWML